MSVHDEITRLETAKSDIETAIETCGVNVPDTEKISAYASYIRQIPSAIFSELNAGPFGGEDAFIRTIEQTDGIIEATTGGLVSSSLSGLAPKIGTSAASTISTHADEWVLASTKGGTPTWRKLPANAFKNDNTNTTYTLSGALSGNTFVSTLTPSSGTATTSTVPAMGKATSSAAGKAGLVPAPAKGEQSKFLRGDGTWQTPSNTVPSALCTTAAATAAKAASFTYFAATAKRYFQINFRYANSASGALTLNVNSTGAKPIYINGSASSASNCTLPAGPYIAYYDGTNYYINTDGTIPRVSHIGHTHDDIYYTESEINDLLDDYLPISGGTLTGSLKINTANWGNQLILNRKNNGSNWGPSIKFYADDSGLGALTMGGNELYVSDVNGSTRTALSKVGHTHASNAITALTGYSKATSASAIATTDSLNTALGKLEYKADLGKSAYDWYKSVTADDTDKLINKWGEIVGFLDSVAEGTDILDEFVTRKTDQTITGKKIFNTNTHTKPLVISRTGGLTEAVAIGVNDSQALFEYTNDEASNSFVFKMINTDTESNSGTGANESSVTFTGSSAGSTVQATTFKGKFISTGGTSAKFVKGDGSLDSNSYATTSSLSNYVTLAGAQTITGKKTFSNGLAITGGTTENTSLPYFLGIDAYADGGAVRYLSASKVCAAIGAAKKDGSNATGTWGISITGNAATATSANTATRAAISDNGVFYIAGTGSTAGTWLGSHSGITSYYTGLTIAYKIPVKGANTTTININNLGAKTIKRNDSNLTTHVPVNSVILLVYDGTYFRWSDYDANSYAYVRQYLTNSTNTEYPLLFRYDTETPSSTYVTKYTRYDSAITVNPSTNTITATNFAGNATTASKLKTARNIKLTGAVTGNVNFDGSGNVTISTSVNHTHDYIPNGTQCIELNVSSVLKNYGGFIDFHYRDANGDWLNSTGAVVSSYPDYTSRIIEDALGQLSVNGTKFKNGLVTSTKFKGSFEGDLTGNASTATTASSCTGNSATASALTSLTASDTASSSATKRKIWMCYADGTTGRPALSDNLAFQTSTNTLFSTNFNGNLIGNVIGNVTGNVSGSSGSCTGNSATATIATRLSLGGVTNDIKYGDYAGIIQSSSNGPETGSWHNSIKILHNNSAGYYTQLAHNFTGTNGLWHRRCNNGTVSNWIRIVDSSNYASVITGTLGIKISKEGGSYSWYNFQQYNASDANPSYYKSDCAIININKYTGWQPWIRAVDSENSSWAIGQYTTNFHIAYINKANTTNTTTHLWSFQKDGTTVLPGAIKLNKLLIPTSSGGTTYGAGTSGQVLKSNGTTVYWASDSNSNTWRAIQVNGTQIAGTGTNTYAVNFKSGTGITVSGTAGSSSAANAVIITNTGVRATTINGNYLRVNTNGKNADLTIPYATLAGKLQASSNTITTTSNDTTAKWGALHNTVHFYSTTGQLTDQPSQYGLVVNFNNSGSEVHQLWLTQASGDAYHRGGNNSGWSGTWRKFLDSSNYTSYVNTTNFPGIYKTGTVTSVTVTGSNGLSGTGTVTTSGTITLSNSGVRSTTINGNYLRVNTNGTNKDLTIPYATSAGSATTASSANWLNTNSDLTYGASGLQYFNATLSTRGEANTNGTPTTDWYHIIRMNHANNGGYYVDLAACFHSSQLHYRRIANGINYGWVRLLDYGMTSSPKAVSHTNWSGTDDRSSVIPTLNFLSYWNGAYNSSNSSNLTYCANGTILGSNNYTSYVNTTNFPGLNKTGTVTSVATGTGLTGGTITGSGTISINSTYQTYISNGNTAYGWGNHAKAGYIKYTSILKGWSDTRSAATKPNDYNGAFKVIGIKSAGTTLGLTSTQAGDYATIIGWRGWSDSSGGYAWEIASTDKNRLYVRSGSTTTWNNGWQAIAYLGDIPTKTSQLTNDRGYITSYNNYYHTRVYSSGLKISTGTGVSNMYVPIGTTSSLGVVKQHTAANCTSYTSDEGATTPAAVKKAVGLFAVTKVSTGTGLTGGDITSTGTISINSTYRTYISNGNTAYRWGNHADAKYMKAVGRHSGSMNLNKIDSTMSVITEIRPSEITTTNLPSDYGTSYGCLISARDGNSTYGHGKMQILGCNKKFWMRATQGAGEENDGTWCRLALTSDLPTKTSQLTNDSGYITSYVDTAAGKTFKTLSSKSHSGWTNNATDNKILPTMSFIAYWNGAYSSANASNLTYCVKGAFGSVVTQDTGWWNGVPTLSGGYMEFGKAIDFHNSSSSTADYDVRLRCNNANGVVVNLPSSAGTLALTSQIPDVSSFITSSSLNGYVNEIETSGSGNAITSASKSGKKITFTKGTTFLTAHQTIYALTIKNSAGTTQLTYTPNSAAGSITLTKAMVGLGNVDNTADANKTVAVANKLGTATKGSTTKPIYLKLGTATECSTYAGGTAVTLNGSSKAASTASFYAPTTAGMSGYLLKSNGSGAPTWTNTIGSRTTSLTASYITTMYADALYLKSYYTPSEDMYISGFTTVPDSTSRVRLYTARYAIIKNNGNSSTCAIYAPGGFYESSDERLKRLLNPIKVDLDAISKLRKIYYTWKDEPNGSRQLGVIAQDVQDLYPELVDVNKDTGYLSLAYDKLSVVALAAIDELYDMIKTLRKENEELKGRLSK